MKQLISVGEKVYSVNRIIKEFNLPVVDEWKQVTKSDIAFRKDGMLFLCNEVLDIEEQIIETNKEVTS